MALNPGANCAVGQASSRYLFSVMTTRGSADFQICCIAGFQPADASPSPKRSELETALPIGNRRYSRLETCYVEGRFNLHGIG